MRAPSRPRIAFFTHDTYGMGHVQRSMRIAGALSERIPDAALLLVTGAAALHRIKERPQNLDFIKVPTVVKTGGPGGKPPHLPIATAEVTHIRERVIRESVLAFDPDVFLVDNFPLGSQRELMPTLHDLQNRKTRVALTLRDIVDSGKKVRADWARQGIYDILDRHYDRVLVCGVPEVLNFETVYELPPTVAAKLRYCGYISPPRSALRAPAEVRAELGCNGSYALATTGGGGDGFPLLAAFLEAFGKTDIPKAIVVTGPLMAEADRERLREIVPDGRAVEIREYLRDLPSHFGAADVVVTMCGYNTASELLAVRPHAVVVPRTWKYGEHEVRKKASSEGEQLMRAEALARLGIAKLIRPEELSADTLADALKEQIARDNPIPVPPVALNGLERVTDEIIDLLEE